MGSQGDLNHNKMATRRQMYWTWNVTQDISVSGCMPIQVSMLQNNYYFSLGGGANFIFRCEEFGVHLN